MHFAALLLASLALGCARASAARPGSPSNVRQFDRLPNLDEALNVAKSPFEPVTLATNSPIDVARTNEEPLATTNRLTPGEENLRTTRSAEQPEAEGTELEGSSNPRGAEDGAGSGGDASSTQAPDESTTGQTGAPQAETSSTAEAETERAGKDEVPTTTTTTSTTAATTTKADAPEAAGSESPGPTSQEPGETTTEAETPSSPTTEETPNSESAAPKEQEIVITTREPETTTTTTAPETSTTTATPDTTTSTTAADTTAAPETTTTTAAPETSTTTAIPDTTTINTATTTTAAPETTPQPSTTTETPTTTSTETNPTTSSSPDSAENDQPKEQPVAELATTTTTTTTTSAPELSSPSDELPSPSAPANDPPPSSSLVDVGGEQQPTATTPTTTTTVTPPPVTVTEAEPTRPQPTVASPTEAPKPKPKDEDEASCNHLPNYDSDEVQKVFREETTHRNGTIKGKFTYINFDQRYRLVHYTRLPYGPVKIDRVEELGKPGQGGSASGSAPSSSSVGDVLQLRNLLPNSLFGFPFLGPHASNRPQTSFGNRNDDPNAHFYSTDSVPPAAEPNLLDSRSHTSSSARSRANDLAAAVPPTSASATPTAHQDRYKASDAPVPQGPHQHGQDQYSRQLNRFERPGESALFPPPGQTGYQFQYSHPFQSANSAGSPDPADRGFSYSYFTASDYQPAGPGQPWAWPAAAVHPAYPLRVGHQLNNNFERRHHPGHHQPHGHEHYVAPFMFARLPAEHLQSAAAGADAERGGSRVKLQVKNSKSLNLDGGRQGQTKSAQLRLQPSEGHYSRLSSPSQTYQRNQQRQRLGKQSHQRHRSLTPSANQAPVVYHVLTSPYNRRPINQGQVMAYDQDK